MSLSIARKERLFARKTTRQQYSSIIDTFDVKCQQSGLSLPQKVFAEFDKRMKAPDASKSKLDLRDCSFSESHIEILFPILCESRSIMKVELRQSKEGKTQEKINKIFARGATAILQALNNQLDFVLNTDIDDRLNCVFMGDIDFDKNAHIDDSMILDIDEASNKLNYCNAMTFIREITLSVVDRGQKTLMRDQLDTIWQKCIGSAPSESKMTGFIDSQPIEYSLLERLIIEEWESKNMLFGVSTASKQLLLNSSEKLKLRLQAEEGQRRKEIMLAEEREREKKRIETEMRKRQMEEEARKRIEEEEARKRIEEEEARKRIEEEDRKQQMEEVRRLEDIGELEIQRIEEDRDDDNLDHGSFNDEEMGDLQQNREEEVEERGDVQQLSKLETPQDSEVDPMEKFRRISGSFHALGKSSGRSPIVAAIREESSSSSHAKNLMPESSENVNRKSSSMVELENRVPVENEIHPNNICRNDLDSAAIVNSFEAATQQKNIDTNSSEKRGKMKKNIDADRNLPRHDGKDKQSPEMTSEIIERIEFSKFQKDEKSIDIRNGNFKCLDFGNLKHLRRLSNLSCSYNQFRNVQGYVPLNIVVLDLSFNRLTDLSCLVTAEGLKHLNVSNNNIKSPVGLPKSLVNLNLSFNELTTVTDILYLSTCTNLECIALEGNPVVNNTSFDWKMKVVSTIPSLHSIDDKPLPRKFNRRCQSNSSQSSSPRMTRGDQEKGDEMRANYKLESRKGTKVNRVAQSKRMKETELKQVFDRLAGNGFSFSQTQHKSVSPKRQISSPTKQLSYTYILQECNDSVVECVKALKVLYIPLHNNVGYTCSSETLEDFSNIEIFAILSTANRIIRELRLLQINDANFGAEAISEIQGLEAVSHILYELFKNCYKSDDLGQSIRFAESILDSCDEGRKVLQYLKLNDVHSSEIDSSRFKNFTSKDDYESGKLQPKLVFERMNKLKQRVMKKIDSNYFSTPSTFKQFSEYSTPEINSVHLPRSSPKTTTPDVVRNLNNDSALVLEKVDESHIMSKTDESFEASKTDVDPVVSQEDEHSILPNIDVSSVVENGASNLFEEVHKPQNSSAPVSEANESPEIFKTDATPEILKRDATPIATTPSSTSSARERLQKRLQKISEDNANGN